MKYISKTHLIILAVIVVILGTMLLLGEHFSRAGFSTALTGDSASPSSTEQEPMLYGQGESQSQIEMHSKSFVIRPGQSKLTYTEALELYKNSLLQFDQDCHVVSRSRSFGLNNEVMIDNRSPKPNTFSVGDAAVVVGPYDFGFMILKEQGTSVSVGCGENKNVATLIVQ